MCGANGVEDFRQKTAENAVEMTGLLLEAGAEINATASFYGGDCTTLDLAATSIHCGDTLLQALLDGGARMEVAGQSIVMGCLANNRLRAAEFLASRGAQVGLVAAAGLGRLELVKSLPGTDLDETFVYACRYGQNRVVEFLLTKNVGVASQVGGQTAMHWAVIGGHLDTVKVLLHHNAPLAIENVYGGTVLGQALWSAAHGGDPVIYDAIVETLVAAGAY